MDTTSLTALADEHLGAAKAASSGRSSHTIFGGHEHSLRQTLIALASGQALDEHESPGDATLQVIRGRVALVSDDVTVEGSAGDLLVIPNQRHRLDALDDSAVLLTVAVSLPE
jgi:quercetin dioxygenase-like cupin family protein